MLMNTQLHWIIGTSANLASCVLSKTTYLVQKFTGWNVYGSWMRGIVNEVDDMLCELMIRYDHREDPIF
jgi:hypothetical protein